MVKVFFNNSCNICKAEISHYKKHSDSNIEWIDVTNNQKAQKITSKTYREFYDFRTKTIAATRSIFSKKIERTAKRGN